jgi:molecular chaperone GrpE
MPEIQNSSSPETPAAAPPDTASAGGEIETLRAELEAARAQVTEHLDKFLRAKAETENFRRRAEADVANAHKFAIERFALEMLAVKDSLERARGMDLQAGGAGLEMMLEGMDLTIRLMESIFQKFALTEISPARGDRFDPEKHQAMSVQESAEVPDQHVLMALQKGYLLNGRLLRPALVIVAKPPASA